MLTVGLEINIVILTFCIWFMPIFSSIFLQFIKHKRFYDELGDIADSLDRKYLLSEVIKEPEFIEGEFIYNLLKQTNKDMH